MAAVLENHLHQVRTQCMDAIQKGALASLLSVAKLPYEDAQDGISNTFSIIPKALGKEDDVQVRNLVSMLDGYAVKRRAPLKY